MSKDARKSLMETYKTIYAISEQEKEQDISEAKSVNFNNVLKPLDFDDATVDDINTNKGSARKNLKGLMTADNFSKLRTIIAGNCKGLSLARVNVLHAILKDILSAKPEETEKAPEKPEDDINKDPDTTDATDAKGEKNVKL